MNLTTTINYVADLLPNEQAAKLKTLENKKYGVHISMMPAKVRGCFQTEHKRVKVSISDNVIGYTCNREQHEQAAQPVLDFIRANQWRFERK